MLLGKNGANIEMLRQADQWLTLPGTNSANTTYYTPKSYPEPPEQALLTGSGAKIGIAHAFLHQVTGSERKVAWITGDIACFHGDTFRVLLACYNLAGNEGSSLLLSALSPEWKPGKEKWLYHSKDSKFVLVELPDFALGAEHAAEVTISDGVLRETRSQGLKQCAVVFQHQSQQESTTGSGRSVRHFELGNLRAYDSSRFLQKRQLSEANTAGADNGEAKRKLRNNSTPNDHPLTASELDQTLAVRLKRCEHSLDELLRQQRAIEAGVKRLESHHAPAAAGQPVLATIDVRDDRAHHRQRHSSTHHKKEEEASSSSSTSSSSDDGSQSSSRKMIDLLTTLKRKLRKNSGKRHKRGSPRK